MTTSTTELDRKSLRRPDEFTKSITNFFDNLAGNSKALGFLVVGLLAIGFGVAYFMNRHAATNTASQNALFMAQKTLMQEEKAVADVLAPAPPEEKSDAAKKSKAPPKNPPAPTGVDAIVFTKLDVDAKFPKSVQQFKSVIETYPGTRGAFEAKMSLGELYYNHRDPAKAVEWYKGAVDAAPGVFEKAFAWNALAYAQENQGKFKEAAESYQQAASMSDHAIRGDALMGLARTQTEQGDKASAKKTYDQIIQQFPNSETSRTAELLKSQLE